MNRNELKKRCLCGFCDLLFPLRSLMDVLFVMHSKAWMMMALSRLGSNWIESNLNLTMAVCVWSWLPVFRWTVSQRLESYWATVHIILDSRRTSLGIRRWRHKSCMMSSWHWTARLLSRMSGSWLVPGGPVRKWSSILTWHILMTLPTFG